MADQRILSWGVVMLAVLLNMKPVMGNYSSQIFPISAAHSFATPIPDTGSELRLSEAKQDGQLLELGGRAVPIRWA